MIETGLLDRARLETRPILLLAHPGSGTQWTSWALRRIGKRGVQHERINSAQTDPPWPGQAVVSFAYWPGETAERRRGGAGLIDPAWPCWLLVRDPLRTVFSAAEVCTREPRHLARICDVTIRDDETRRWAVHQGPLIAMLVSFVSFLDRAGEHATATYRVEDIPDPGVDPGHRNSHTKTVASWMDLARAAERARAQEWSVLLALVSRRLGYPDSDPAPAAESRPSAAASAGKAPKSGAAPALRSFQ